jgi:DNA-binding beta-propeller fold protein YncE
VRLQPCIILLLAALAICAMTSCAVEPRVAPFPAADGPVWPAPPAASRLAYVGAFSVAADLGIRGPIWRRLADFALGADPQRLVAPIAVATDAAGQVIYVADPGSGAVHRFDRVHNRYRRLARRGGEPLPSPVALVVSTDGRVYVADSKLGEIYVARPDSDHFERVTLTAPLSQPTGLAIDRADERIFVANTASHSVKVFAANGEFLTEFGGRGTGPGQLNYPTFLWLDPQRRLYVTDSLNFRIQRFAADGSYLNGFGSAGTVSGTLARPKGVAVDRAGHVYVVDALFHAIQVFDAHGEFLFALGEQGQDPGQFWLPAGIFISADDMVYVADTQNHRVQVFRYVGVAP